MANSERILHQYAERARGHEGLPSPTEPDEADDVGCFGWLRASRDRCVMLELRKRSGERLAINYGWIESIAFDPSTGISLVAGRLRIEIAGTHLNTEQRPHVRLFEGLTRHKVPWIAETSPIDSGFRADVTAVHQIDWKQ